MAVEYGVKHLGRSMAATTVDWVRIVLRRRYSRPSKYGKSQMPVFIWDVKSQLYISEGGVRGAKPLGFFVILRIKNKRVSLKSFISSVQNSGFKMLRNLLVWYLVGTS